MADTANPRPTSRLGGLLRKGSATLTAPIRTLSSKASSSRRSGDSTASKGERASVASSTTSSKTGAALKKVGSGLRTSFSVLPNAVKRTSSKLSGRPPSGAVSKSASMKSVPEPEVARADVASNRSGALSAASSSNALVRNTSRVLEMASSFDASKNKFPDEFVETMSDDRVVHDEIPSPARSAEASGSAEAESPVSSAASEDQPAMMTRKSSKVLEMANSFDPEAKEFPAEFQEKAVAEGTGHADDAVEDASAAAAGAAVAGTAAGAATVAAATTGTDEKEASSASASSAASGSTEEEDDGDSDPYEAMVTEAKVAEGVAVDAVDGATDNIVRESSVSNIASRFEQNTAGGKSSSESEGAAGASDAGSDVAGRALPTEKSVKNMASRFENPEEATYERTISSDAPKPLTNVYKEEVAPVAEVAAVTTAVVVGASDDEPADDDAPASDEPEAMARGIDIDDDKEESEGALEDAAEEAMDDAEEAIEDAVEDAEEETAMDEVDEVAAKLEEELAVDEPEESDVDDAPVTMGTRASSRVVTMAEGFKDGKFPEELQEEVEAEGEGRFVEDAPTEDAGLMRGASTKAPPVFAPAKAEDESDSDDGSDSEAEVDDDFVTKDDVQDVVEMKFFTIPGNKRMQSRRHASSPGGLSAFVMNNSVRVSTRSKGRVISEVFRDHAGNVTDLEWLHGPKDSTVHVLATCGQDSKAFLYFIDLMTDDNGDAGGFNILNKHEYTCPDGANFNKVRLTGPLPNGALILSSAKGIRMIKFEVKPSYKWSFDDGTEDVRHRKIEDADRIPPAAAVAPVAVAEKAESMAEEADAIAEEADDAIAEEADAIAEEAQSVAEDAVADAEEAVSVAEEAMADAEEAEAEAEEAVEDAEEAVEDAEEAVVEEARETFAASDASDEAGDDASSDPYESMMAEAAAGGSDKASEVVNTAVEDADEAMANAEEALTDADEAVAHADEAVKHTEEAVSDAEGALANADEAIADAASAEEGEMMTRGVSGSDVVEDSEVIAGDAAASDASEEAADDASSDPYESMVAEVTGGSDKAYDAEETAEAAAASDASEGADDASSDPYESMMKEEGVVEESGAVGSDASDAMDSDIAGSGAEEVAEDAIDSAEEAASEEAAMESVEEGVARSEESIEDADLSDADKVEVPGSPDAISDVVSDLNDMGQA